MGLIILDDFRYKISARNDLLEKKPSFFIRTYGCQMNERDSEKMAGLLTQIGFATAASQDDADLVLYNTCCVRESAEDKVIGHLSYLKRLKTERPFILAVGGCMPQQKNIAQLLKEKHKYVDLVFGTTNRHRLPEFLWRVMEKGERVVDISEGDDLPEITDIAVTTREFSHKAGVNIMYGCDNFCSYCIVPYVRGRERSRPMAEILEEVRALASDGVKEIMLLGQNVNSYAGGIADWSFAARTARPSDPGQVSNDEQPSAFPELLRHVNEIEGLKRIRFMTSHPKDFSDELIAAVRDCEKVCKSVHLPLQAGSSRVLADMNRQYSKEGYISLAEKLYAAIPGLALTTDIIVGFPGETEDDFEDTLDIVRNVRFAGAFTFIYSKRSGTPAAERTDLIPRKTANERFDRLTAELYSIMTEKNMQKVGHVIDVMVEEAQPNAESINSCKNQSSKVFSYRGRADDHTLVHFTAEKEFLAGEITPVRVNTAKTFYVSGSAV